MIIGLDQDGVTAHFTKTFLEYFGLNVDIFEPRINQFDIVKALPELPRDAYAQFADAVNRLNVCSTIPTYPGAREFVDALRAQGHTVLACTSPFNAAWLSQRAAWLERHMVIPLKQQIHCSDKSRIDVDVLIDDNIHHCYDWQFEHEYGTAITFDRPWNQLGVGNPFNVDPGKRAMSYAHCLELLR